MSLYSISIPICIASVSMFCLCVYVCLSVRSYVRACMMEGGGGLKLSLNWVWSVPLDGMEGGGEMVVVCGVRSCMRSCVCTYASGWKWRCKR